MHPILFQVGDNFFIGTYGVMIAIGLMVAVSLASWRAGRRGFPAEMIFDIAFVAVLSGFIGGRVLYILLNFSDFLEHPLALILSRTGFVFLGGFLASTVCTILYIRRKGLPVLDVGDVLVPSLALAHGFGRIGCHLAGCCWGGVCPVPGLGIHLERHAMSGGGVWENAFEDQLRRGLVDALATTSLPVWPVQLMEMGGLFLICAFLLWFASKPRAAGKTLSIYLAAYGVLRFGLEFLRGDEERGLFFGGMLSTSQLISLGLVVAGAALLAWTWKRPVSVYSHPSLAPPRPEGDGDSTSSSTADPAQPSGRRPRKRYTATGSKG